MPRAKALTPEQQHKTRNLRWRCRTDLEFLCQHVIGYKNVERKVHGPILDILQKFPFPEQVVRESHDKYDPYTGKWLYKPIFPLAELEGKRRRLILCPRSHLKCVEPSSLIQTCEGDYREARSLSVGDYIWGVDEHIRPIKTRIEAIEKQEPQKCYRLKFRTGKELTVSWEHPFRSISGWIKACDLVKGQKLALKQTSTDPGGSYVPFAGALGWFLGDGSFRNQTVTNISAEIREKVIEDMEKAGGRAHVSFFKERTPCVRVQGLRELWKSLELLDTKSGNKFVPTIFFKADNQSVKELLYAYFMCDGTWGKNGISYTTKSKRLGEDIQRLLLRFGIVAKLCKVTLRTGQYQGNVYYYGTISTCFSSIFEERIGWGKQKRERVTTKTICNTVPGEVQELCYGIPTSPYSFSKAKIKAIGKALNNSFLLSLGGEEIYWDEIIDIKDVGALETLAIQTDSKTLIVDDIVTHNTTINVQAHTIQWLINYPDIALAIFQSNSEKAEMILKAIKDVFKYNPLFRSLFPEHCPFKGIDDWGKVGEFTTESRQKGLAKREPSVIALALEKGTAGMHFDVMKFSDVVEPENIKRPEAITSAFYMAENLLVASGSWIDVEGTRYVFNDLYGDIIDKYKAEKRKAIGGGKTTYDILVTSCYKRIGPKGEEPKHTPEELDWPFLKVEGKPVPWWPKDNEGQVRFTNEYLERLEANDPYIFSAQQLNNPIGGIGGKAVFVVNKDTGPPFVIKRAHYNTNVKGRIVYRDMVVDTAYTSGPRSNFTAMVIGAWDGFGRCYIEEIVHGKFSASELIDKIIALATKYTINSLKLEKVPFNEGLMAGLKREQELRGINLPFELLKRDNQTSKVDRISSTLPSFYSSGTLRFLEDLSPGNEEESKKVWEHLSQELRQFPIGTNDDLIDAITDLFQNKDVMGRLTAQKTVTELEDIEKKRFLRFVGIDSTLDEDTRFSVHPHFNKTGGL